MSRQRTVNALTNGRPLVRAAAVLIVVFAGAASLHADWRLQSGYDDSRLLSDVSGVDLTFGRIVHRASFQASHSDVTGSFRLALIRPHGKLTTVDPDGFSIIMHSKAAGSAFDAVLGWRDSTIVVEGGSLLRDDRTFDWRLGAGGRISTLAAVSLAHDESEHVPRYLFLSYLGEGGEVQLDAPLARDGISVELTPLAGWAMSSRIESGRFHPSTPALQEDPANLYRATLDGEIRYLQTGLTHTPGGRWKIVGQYAELSAHTRLMGYADGRRFAHFGLLDLTSHWWRLDVVGPRVRSCIWSGRATATAAGTVQAFPFFDDLFGFLGQRRHVMADAALDFRLTELSGRLLDRRVSLDCGGVWLRLHPRAAVVSWRPGPLGLGVEDLTSDSLSVRRADLLRLNAALSVTTFGLTVSGGASQWLPLSVAKIETDDGSQINTPSDGGSSNSHTAGHSGFSFSLTVSRRL